MKENLNRAEKMKNIARLAVKRLGGLKKPIVQICGPISTGGTGDTKKNIQLLRGAINLFKKNNFNVFNQLDFENAIDQALGPKIKNKYDQEILDLFYGPILESGLINKLYFLPGWEKSIGSKWEYKKAIELGIETEILKKNWSDECTKKTRCL